MESSLIKFIKRYRDKKISFTKLKEAWKTEIDKEDFDHNEKETFLWFQSYRQERLQQ